MNLPSGGQVSNKKSSSKGGPRIEAEGWKEVTRRSKKVAVPATAISRVIGRGGCNINAVREISGAHIEVEKQRGQPSDRQIIIKGSADATKNAQILISALVNEPEKELNQIVTQLGLSLCPPGSASECEDEGTTFLCPPSVSVQTNQSSSSHSSSNTNIPSSAAARVSKPTSASTAPSSPVVVSKSSLVSVPVSKSNVFVTTPMSAAAFAPRPSSTITVRGPAPAASQPFTGQTWLASAKSTSSSSSINSALPSRIVSSQPQLSNCSPSASATISYTVASSVTSSTASSLNRTRVAVSSTSTASSSTKTIAKPVANTDLKLTAPAFGSARPSSQPFAPRSPKPSQASAQRNEQQAILQQQQQQQVSSQLQILQQQQQEYTPFTNNMFSKVASVWGSKDSRPNFASVAAQGIPPSQAQHVQMPLSQQQQMSASMNSSLSIQPMTSAQLEAEHNAALADASKAPGYRGNFISPSLSSTPSSSNSSAFGVMASGHRSAPCTPPLLSSGNGGRGQPTPPESSISPPPSQMRDNSSFSVEQMLFSSSSAFSPVGHSSSYNSQPKSFNLAPGARGSNYNTSTTFSQHGSLSSVGSSIAPPPGVMSDSLVGNSQGNSNLNPNAPDFSGGGPGGRQQQQQLNNNGSSLLRPVVNMQQQSPQQSNIRGPIPFQEVLPNPQLQMQMRAAILAAGASLQMQTLQQQQARFQNFGAAQVQAAAAVAASMGQPDFNPPSAETLRLLHTAIAHSSFPSSSSSTGNIQSGGGPGSGTSNPNQASIQGPYGMMQSPARGQVEGNKADSSPEDRKASLRPIGTERAQRKNPYGGGFASDLWPMDMVAEPDWMSGASQFNEPLNLLQNSYNTNRVFDQLSSVDQVLDQQFQVSFL